LGIRAFLSGLLASVIALAVAAGAGAKTVSLTGALGYDTNGPYVSGGFDPLDGASSVSMDVVVKKGRARKVKNISVTYTYECLDDREGVDWVRFPGSIRIKRDYGGVGPGFESKPGGYDILVPGGKRVYLWGQVSRRGKKVSGQIFVNDRDYECWNTFAGYLVRR